MKIVILAASILALTGCASGKLEIRKYTPGTASDGIVYSLPKTLLKMSIPYHITVTESNGHTRARAESGIATISTVQVPDPDHSYEIRTDLKNSFTWQNSFSADISEDGYLTRSDAAFKDNSLAALKGLTELVLPFSKQIFPSLMETATELEQLQDRQKENAARLLLLFRRSTQEGLSAAEVKQLKDEIALIVSNEEIIQKRVDRLTNRTEADVAFTCVIEPVAGKFEYDITPETCPSLRELVEGIRAQLNHSLPDGFTTSYRLKLSGIAEQAPEAPSKESGAYYYRLPFRGAYTLTATGDSQPAFLGEGQITVNQLGSIGRIYVKGKRFAKKTVSVSLHPTTGGLKSYSSASEGTPAESLTKTSTEISAAVRDALREPTELETLKAEIELLKAKIDRIKKEKELEELLKEED